MIDPFKRGVALLLALPALLLLSSCAPIEAPSTADEAESDAALVEEGAMEEADAEEGDAEEGDAEEGDAEEGGEVDAADEDAEASATDEAYAAMHAKHMAEGKHGEGMGMGMGMGMGRDAMHKAML